MLLVTYDIECLERVKCHIDADLSVHYPISDLARYAMMGETKLKSLFRQYYGQGLFEYLQQQRMELAADLLQVDKYTIKIVARKCGYRHYSNFSAAFKAYHGVRPGKYRRLVRVS